MAYIIMLIKYLFSEIVYASLSTVLGYLVTQNLHFVVSKLILVFSSGQTRINFLVVYFDSAFFVSFPRFFRASSILKSRSVVCWKLGFGVEHTLLIVELWWLHLLSLYSIPIYIGRRWKDRVHICRVMDGVLVAIFIVLLRVVHNAHFGHICPRSTLRPWLHDLSLHRDQLSLFI